MKANNSGRKQQRNQEDKPEEKIAQPPSHETEEGEVIVPRKIRKRKVVKTPPPSEHDSDEEVDYQETTENLEVDMASRGSDNENEIPGMITEGIDLDSMTEEELIALPHGDLAYYLQEARRDNKRKQVEFEKQGEELVVTKRQLSTSSSSSSTSSTATSSDGTAHFTRMQETIPVFEIFANDGQKSVASARRLLFYTQSYPATTMANIMTSNVINPVTRVMTQAMLGLSKAEVLLLTPTTFLERIVLKLSQSEKPEAQAPVEDQLKTQVIFDIRGGTKKTISEQVWSRSVKALAIITAQHGSDVESIPTADNKNITRTLTNIVKSSKQNPLQVAFYDALQRANPLTTLAFVEEVTTIAASQDEIIAKATALGMVFPATNYRDAAARGEKHDDRGGSSSSSSSSSGSTTHLSDLPICRGCNQGYDLPKNCRYKFHPDFNSSEENWEDSKSGKRVKAKFQKDILYAQRNSATGEELTVDRSNNQMWKFTKK